MKTRILAVAMILLGVAAAAGIVLRDPAAMELVGSWSGVCLTLSIVFAISGAIAGLTSFSASGRTSALLRLDWFLPFLRKKKKRETLAPPPLIVRLAKAILPNALFADRVAGKPGLIRRLLRWLGPSVLASPVRRVVQAVCLVVFLYSFFYVCWPYTAKPAAPGRVSSGWRFDEVDQAAGEFLLKGGKKPWAIEPQTTLHLVDESVGDAAQGYIGPFTLAAGDDNQVSLLPASDLPPEQLDLLLVSVGPWALHESEPGRWPSHYADDLAAKERLPAETFLAIDPLVSLSTAIASGSWVWSLGCAAIILIVCVLIPRGFCGYLCPLGTLIDLFDWAIAGRVQRFRVPEDGWWVHVKYYLLAGTLMSATMGVLVAGVVAAIPVVTRGMLFLGEPLQSGSMRGWYLVPPVNAGHFLSIGLFVSVLCLGFLRPRFWCKYVCPSGAVFSLGNLFRATERKVESSCIHCNKCVEICPFDAIKPDFTTRVTDCTMCQSCGGVCPTDAIKFVERWNVVELKTENNPPTGETPLGRRGFLSLAAGAAAAVAGGAATAASVKAFGANLDDPDSPRPVRPPGSVPEQEFLQMCIRCGECFKVCPNNVLQAEGFQQGLEGLWAPLVDADWAGCESSCNACGQVCPTGAIRALPMEEKKVARMGLAIVNPTTCLPLAGKEDCDLCVQECNAAGYHAIEYVQVHTEVDDDGVPLEGTGFLAPVVSADKCVGCGLCQTRCYGVNVQDKHLLEQSAIIIEAGEGKEDRLSTGSYVELREQEAKQRELERQAHSPNDVFSTPPDDADDSKTPEEDPFGIDAEPNDAEPDPFGLED